MSEPGTGSQNPSGTQGREKEPSGEDNQKKQENNMMRSQAGQNKRVSQGKIREIKCRYCSKEMKHQNYETHLKYKHPGKISKT